MQTRFIQTVGLEVELYVYWGDNACPAAPSDHFCPHGASKAKVYMGTAMERAPKAAWAVLDDEWPTQCQYCRQARPPLFQRTVNVRPLYDTPDRRSHPGDVYFRPCFGTRSGCPWDNCPGQHLVAVCPNGFHWDVDARASNCDRRPDRLHRCWVRRGEPPAVHVDKGHRGNETCGAGAGSIDAPGVGGTADWHGFLHRGTFVPC